MVEARWGNALDTGASSGIGGEFARTLAARGCDLAAVQPGPFNTTYAATKAFVASSSGSLHGELRGTAVTAMALCPGFVRTEFPDAADVDAGAIPSAASLDATDVVTTALRDLERGDAVSIPGLGYRTLGAVSRITPGPVVRGLWVRRCDVREGRLGRERGGAPRWPEHGPVGAAREIGTDRRDRSVDERKDESHVRRHRGPAPRGTHLQPL